MSTRCRERRLKAFLLFTHVIDDIPVVADRVRRRDHDTTEIIVKVNLSFFLSVSYER